MGVDGSSSSPPSVCVTTCGVTLVEPRRPLLLAGAGAAAAADFDEPDDLELEVLALPPDRALLTTGVKSRLELLR